MGICSDEKNRRRVAKEKSNENMSQNEIYMSGIIESNKNNKKEKKLNISQNSQKNKINDSIDSNDNKKNNSNIEENKKDSKRKIQIWKKLVKEAK